MYVLIKVSAKTDTRPPETARQTGSAHLWACPQGVGQSEPKASQGPPPPRGV